MAFQKARRGQAKLRAALIGVAGSGKTMTALLLAKGLGERIAVVDTENFSASKYADAADFDVQALETFEVERYIKAIHEAEEGGYDVLIIDSLSHAWAGPGGVLDFVDNKKAASRNGDGRDAWRAATPLQNKLVQAMLQSKCHIIATMRAKTEYETQKDERGRVKMVKVGLAPVQRDQLEYEFDLVGTVDETHTVVWSKTRYSPWTDKAMERPGVAAGQELRRWLSDGVAPAPAPVVGRFEAPRETVAKAAKVAEVKERVEKVLGRAPGIVTFGPAKGKAIPELSDRELADTIDLGDAKLAESPDATWHDAVKANLDLLLAEHALRQKVPAREVGSEG